MSGSRSMTAAIAIAVVLAPLGTSCNIDFVGMRADMMAAQHDRVVRMVLIQVVDGPVPGAPLRDGFTRPFGSAVGFIPSPLPPPLVQPESCTSGLDLVIERSYSGSTTYGPCIRPPSIDRLVTLLERLSPTFRRAVGT